MIFDKRFKKSETAQLTNSVAKNPSRTIQNLNGKLKDWSLLGMVVEGLGHLESFLEIHSSEIVGS